MPYSPPKTNTMNKLIITSSLILMLGLFSCKKETVTSTSSEEIATGKPPSPPPPASILQWQKCLGTSTDDFGNAVAKTSDGIGYFVAGTTGPNGSHDAIVSKIGLTGAPLWQTPTIVGGSAQDEAYGVVATPDGGCLVAGYTTSNDGDLAGISDGGGDVLLFKLSPNGSKEWVKTIGGSGGDRANALIATTDGGYALTGYTNSTDRDVTNSQVVNGRAIVWLVKFNITTGGPIIEWQKTIGDPDNISRHGYALVEAANGGFTIAGTVYTDPAPDIWIINTDDLGIVKYTKRISSGVGADVAFGVTASTDGYLVTGYLSSSNLFVAKLKLDLSDDWQKIYSGGSTTGSIRGRSVISTSEGDIIVGSTNSRNGSIIASKGSDDLFVLRLNDATGDIIGTPYVLGGNKSDAGYNVIPTNDGYVVVGNTYSNNADVLGNNGGSDMWVVKFKFPE
jgi:hypothetical protein